MAEIVLPITYRSDAAGLAGEDWLKLEQVEELLGNSAAFKKWANVTGNLPETPTDVFSAWEQFITK